jgi:hypothetical protein
MLITPHCAIAASSSSLRIASTRSTPLWPSTAGAQIAGRPMKTARAPHRECLEDVGAPPRGSVVVDLEPASRGGHGLRLPVQRRLGVGELKPAVVGDHDPVDAVVGAERRVLGGGSALENDRAAS